MKITVPAEDRGNETRVPFLPETVAQLVKAGIQVDIEAGLGAGLYMADETYQQAGASIFLNREEALKEAEFVAGLNPLEPADIARLQAGCTLLSFIEPFDRPDILEALLHGKITAISMEMIPRTTLAQKMDALSSQASIAGYAAVLRAAERFQGIFPMMMTPAGTIKPARVFIIGAGVAGLQAIATARRLGARVDAFDTRPVVAEQVQSLGAKFLKVDLGETGQTRDGYAKALTEEQLKLQREAMAKACAQSDIVITTAQLFGRKAPVIITRDMVEGMKPGSILVDLAVTSGGNIEGSTADEEVVINGVRILGVSNFPGLYPLDASRMYGSNLANFILHFRDPEAKTFHLDRENEIIRSSLVTFNGELVNEFLTSRLTPEQR